MAVVPLGLLGSAIGKAAGTTLDIQYLGTNPLPAGTFLVLAVTLDNPASVTAPTLSLTNVSGGATWTRSFATAVGSGVTTTAGSGIWHQTWYVKTTADIVFGNLFATVNTTSVVAKAAVICGWSGVSTTVRSAAVTATSTTGAPTATAGSVPAVGDLIVGTIGGETPAIPTGASNATDGTWDAIQGTNTTGGSAATNVCVGIQGKVSTGTSSLSYAATTLLDSVASIMILQPAPNPLVTQAAYRFYADGTEAASTALAAQDTAYSLDLSSGDANVLLRCRMQETAGGTVPKANWQLQWEKNASGTWQRAGSVASNFRATSSASTILTAATGASLSSLAQSFYGDGNPLTGARFNLGRQVAANGNVWAELYAHTGTFGSTGVPTGAALATSATIAVSSLPTGTSEVVFTFDGSVTPASGTPYFIAINTSNTDTGSNLTVYIAPGDAGNQAGFQNAAWATRTDDLLYQVETSPPGVTGYASANLTDGVATTNRLTGGTGTFNAGQVSEDGLVDNYALNVSAFTELLFAITVKQADLANADVMRFRVLKDGVTTGMTYTATPTLNVVKSVAAITCSPSAIAGGEAFGSPTVSISVGATSTAPTAVASVEAFGTPTLSSVLPTSPTAIASAQAFGSPSISAVVGLSPTAIGSGEASGSPSVSTAVTLSPTSVAGVEALGSPAVSATSNVNPTGIGSLEAFGVTNLSGVVAVAPNNIATGEAFGSPTLGAVIALSPGAIASAQGLGTPTLALSVALSPSGVASGQAFGAPALAGAVVLLPSAISSAEASGTPTLNLVVVLSPLGSASGEAVGTPSMQSGLTVLPGAIASAQALGNPVASLLVALLLGAIPSAEAFGLPVASVVVFVQPTAVVSAEGSGSPSISQVTFAVPSGIASASALGTPVLTAVVLVSPSGIVSLFGLGDPVLASVVVLAPTSIASLEVFGAPALSSAAILGPTGVASLEAMGNPALALSVLLLPLAISSAEALGSPVATAFTTLSPTAIASSQALGTPSLSVAMLLAPPGVASAAAMGTPVLFAYVLTSPVGVASDEALGTPDVTTAVSVLVVGIPPADGYGSPTVVVVVVGGALGATVAVAVLTGMDVYSGSVNVVDDSAQVLEDDGSALMGTYDGTATLEAP